MKRLLFILIIAFTITSCNSTQEIANPSVEKDYSYLALGDSYTIGEGVEATDRWPVQLVSDLNARGYKVAPPKIVAATGWTTRNLINGIEREILVNRKFDMVSILIGVNNQYQGKLITEYEVELEEIFRKAIHHSKRGEAGVFALSIPDYGVTPFGSSNSEEISADIDRFNEVFRRVAEQYGVAFYNITPISRNAGTDESLTASDNLHPSAKMYRLWVDEILEDVVNILQTPVIQ